MGVLVKAPGPGGPPWEGMGGGLVWRMAGRGPTDSGCPWEEGIPLSGDPTGGLQ